MKHHPSPLGRRRRGKLSGVSVAERVGQPAASAPDRPRHPWVHWRPGAAAWAATVGAAAGAVVFLLAHHAFPDDGYISLSYARTLATTGTWGVYPGVTDNTQTGPLNVWLLAGQIASGVDPVAAVGVLLAATLAVSGWWADGIRRDLGLSRLLPYVAVLLLASSPLLVSTLGLETYLGCAVLTGVARYAVAGRPVLVGVLCGAAVLTRPDLAVPAAVLVLGVLSAGRGLRRWALVLPVAAAVALPWHFWAWFHLGGFVPDTTWLKTRGGGGPADYTMFTAPVEFWGGHFPVATSIAAAPVAAALVCAAIAVFRWRQRWARPVLALVVAGWAHVTTLWAIGAAAGGWYYGVVIGASALAVAVTVATGHWPARVTTAAVTVGAVVLAVVSLPAPWTVAPIVANLARSPQYMAIARQLGGLTGGQPVASPSEVGAFAFASSVPVVDELTTPALIGPVMDRRYAESGPAMRAFLRWNWAHRPPTSMARPPYRLDFAVIRPPLDGRVVATWPVDTPAAGPQTLVLTEVSARR